MSRQTTGIIKNRHHHWKRPIDIRGFAMEFVTFNDEQDRIPKGDRGALVSCLGHHEVTERKKGVRAFSLATYYLGEQRGDKGVASVTGLVYNLDHIPRFHFKWLRQRLALSGYAYCMYSTYSHMLLGEDDYCLRIILPLSRDLQPPEYETIWSALNCQLFDAFADSNSKKLSQIHYFPACPPEREKYAFSIYWRGRIVDVDDFFTDSGNSPPEGTSFDPDPT